MCGIFGQAVKSASSINRDKNKILGIYNIDRGRHSCGYFNGGKIHKGAGKEKLWDDYIVMNTMKKPQGPVFLGHTRQATVGSHTVQNAHPFGFGEPVGDCEHAVVGMHNGSLHNHEQLATDRGIPLKKKIPSQHNQNGYYLSDKVDSELLLECLIADNITSLENGDGFEDFSVLEDYNGAAALAFTDTQNPNVLYLYHGKSYKYHNPSVNDKQVEERPLFIFQKSKNVMYFSSLMDSLCAIMDRDEDLENIFEAPFNTVFKITDGNFIQAEEFPINRDNMTQGKNWGSHHGQKMVNSHQSSGKKSSVTKALPANTQSNNKDSYTVLGSEEVTLKDGRTKLTQFLDSPFIRVQEGKFSEARNYDWDFGDVVFYNMRYFILSHDNVLEPLNGIYIPVPEKDLFLVGSTPTAATGVFNLHVRGKYYDTKELQFTDKQMNITDEVIFPGHYTIANDPFYYFVNGMQVRTRQDYNIVMANIETYNIAQMSAVTTHPVFSYQKGSSRHVFYNGEAATGSFSPMFSNRRYYFDKGLTKNIVSIDEKSDCPIRTVYKAAPVKANTTKGSEDEDESNKEVVGGDDKKHVLNMIHHSLKNALEQFENAEVVLDCFLESPGIQDFDPMYTFVLESFKTLLSNFVEEANDYAEGKWDSLEEEYFELVQEQIEETVS